MVCGHVLGGSVVIFWVCGHFLARGLWSCPKDDTHKSRRVHNLFFKIICLAFVIFWDRRILGLGDLCLCLSFLVEVQRPAAFQSGQCSSHAAFLVGRAGQLPCCFSSGQCSFSCLFGATGTLAVPGGWTSPPHCELRTILQTDIFRHRFFQSQRSLHTGTA